MSPLNSPTFFFVCSSIVYGMEDWNPPNFLLLHSMTPVPPARHARHESHQVANVAWQSNARARCHSRAERSSFPPYGRHRHGLPAVWVLTPDEYFLLFARSTQRPERPCGFNKKIESETGTISEFLLCVVTQKNWRFTRQHFVTLERSWLTLSENPDHDPQKTDPETRRYMWKYRVGLKLSNSRPGRREAALHLSVKQIPPLDLWYQVDLDGCKFQLLILGASFPVFHC